jgi:hypothetical protein
VEIAEKAFGKPLPKGAVVHHVDLDPTNNAPTNLVVCPSHAYHNLLHQRQRAFDACGRYDWLKCQFCKQYDDPTNLERPGPHAAHQHRECAKAYQRTYQRLRYAARKAITNPRQLENAHE